jgi:hypothetical protein
VRYPYRYGVWRGGKGSLSLPESTRPLPRTYPGIELRCTPHHPVSRVPTDGCTRDAA